MKFPAASVVPSLAARGEVEERAGLRRRLTQMAARAAGRLCRGGDAAELRPDPDHSDRVVKELFPEVALRLGYLEERVRASVGKPWLWKVSIARGHHQLVDPTDTLIDELAQLGRAVALRDGDASPKERQDDGDRAAGWTPVRRSAMPHGHALQDRAGEPLRLSWMPSASKGYAPTSPRAAFSDSRRALSRDVEDGHRRGVPSGPSTSLPRGAKGGGTSKRAADAAPRRRC
jgi:hypothetical protein